MRYPKPDSTKLARRAVKVIPYNDYLGGFLLILLFAASVAFTIPMSIAVSVFFAIFGLPALYVVGLYIEMFRGSVKVDNTDHNLREAAELLNKVRGEYTEQLALPIARKIFQHQAEGNHPNYSGSCYGDCGDRLKVMRKLVPAVKTSDDKTDIQNALDFIRARKELE